MKFSSGRPETECGKGSTLAATSYLRERLRPLLDDLGVRRLLDAPCGDFNWMAHVDLDGIEYVGCDLSLPNLQTARTRSGKDFRHLDIVSQPLPDADAMLCRDFHQHLPNKLAWDALRNFRESGIRWLIATNHNAPQNRDIEAPGGFRRLNLCIAPFHLPEPEHAIADPPGSGRTLAVWHRLQIAQAINDSSASDGKR